MIRTPEQKYALLFEALKRSLLVIHRLRRRLSTSLGEVEALLRKRTTFEEQAADALVDAISLIDFLHRYGALADALPLVPKRAKPLAKLRTTLVDVEVARNYLQHIRGDLSTNAGISYPVLGAVMWSTGPDAYNLQFSQAIEANLQAVFEVDRRGPLGPQSRLRFRCKDTIVKLDDAIAEVDNSYAWINDQVKSDDPAFSELKWGETLVLFLQGSQPAK